MTIDPDDGRGTPVIPPDDLAYTIQTSPSPQADNFALGALRLLRKHALLLLGCLFSGLLAAVIVNFITTTEYTANANVQLTPDSANQFRLEQAVGGDIDSTKLDTDIEVLRSSTLALQTIRSLRLESNRYFIAQLPSRAWDITSASDRQVLAAVFVSHLNIVRLGHTNIIRISVTSSNPQLAADICNELIKNYREDAFKNNYAATEEVSRWLQAQLGQLKQRLEASQEKLLELQRDIGLIGVQPSQSIVVSRLENLSRDLTQAEADRLVLQGRLIALRTSPAGVVDTLSADPLLLQLRQREAQLADEYAGLLSRYGVANPRVVEAGLQMSKLTEAIREEERNAVLKVEKELGAALRSEGTLRATLTAEQQRAYATNSKALTYSLAQREYEADRTLYDGLQAKLQEAGILAGLHSTSSRVIDAADIPSGPSKPRKAFNLITGSAAGVAFGILTTLLLESLDTRITTIADVEDSLGLPLLGVIPRAAPTELVPDHFIHSAMQSSPAGWSQVAEAYRSLRTAILLSRPGAPPQVILITSSQPGEGKTSVASLESILLAITGGRTLLLDADLRRPSIHLRFGLLNINGLSSVLTGRSELNASLCTVASLPLLSILPAGPSAPMPAELLGSTQMRDLLSELRKHYDYILIDTPPALTVTDASVLASLTDGAVVVLQYGKATRTAVTRTSLLLRRAGARILGVVINAANYKSPEYADYYGDTY